MIHADLTQRNILGCSSEFIDYLVASSGEALGEVCVIFDFPVPADSFCQNRFFPHFDSVAQPYARVIAVACICSVKHGVKVLSLTISHSDLIADSYDFLYTGCEPVLVYVWGKAHDNCTCTT